MLVKVFSDIIYIARGLGIILVVIGHYMWHPNWIWSPYLFHMPLFFFIGGLTVTPFKKIYYGIRKLSIELFIYYIQWYVIIAIITYFITQTWKTSIIFNLGTGIDFFIFPWKHNNHNNSLFMVGWFIIAYFSTSVIFKIILTNIKPETSKINMLIFGVTLGITGIEVISPYYHTNKTWWVNVICQVCVGIMYFSIGYCLRDKIGKIIKFSVGLLSAFILGLLVFSGIAHELGMSWSQYPDGFLVHLATSLLGIVSVLSFAKKLNKTILKGHLIMIGQFSKSIMTLHILWLVITGLCLGFIGIVDINKISALHHEVNLPLSIIYIIMSLYGSIITAKILKMR
ncbi:acyltransferase family protein [Vibrio sp. SM6]|uniref:Acyltransferase family protein n=1 Tax=Vibrio agarilyticus TaxID=2726741 RepID=A0A7X8YI53_9VIBR|nr:acyltransferase family protein [Vibrio agarilyticus]NLS14231.1 acyltransferase family protein [Vibrio agarilyticus]